MDVNLKFMEKVSTEELEIFVDVMIKKGGITERLTKSKEYNAYQKEYKLYLGTIMDEYQKFGTNTVVNMFGKPKSYKEILCDVSKKMNVKFDEDFSTSTIETLLLERILLDIWEAASPEEKVALKKEMKEKYGNIPRDDVPILLEVFRTDGVGAYKIILMIEDALAIKTLGRGVKSAAKFALVRLFGSLLGGPISLVLNTYFAITDIAGPAYRVTIPCTVLIAAMRKKIEIKERLNVQDEDELLNMMQA